MSQNLTISETGLKLIKAFEGYRPVDRELINGQRIVGYGHRLYSEDAVMMNKREAESVLRGDLEPFEDMINSEVHAPMSQSQFDALCSFAFNIGPKAFLKSDTLRALNNGRPLDAANGLDIWRKSEIAGKTYIVDALMRRRTAEKALFLRTERDLPAGREDLPPIQDTAMKGLSTDDGLPVFTQDDANGLVATAPYTAVASPARRREDGVSGALQLSELDVIDDREQPETTVPGRTLADKIMGRAASENDKSTASATDVTFDLDEEEGMSDAFEPVDTKPSPIAAAATDIVARLDALIEDADTRFEDRDTDWPKSLITAESDATETSTPADNVIDLNTRTTRPIEAMDGAPAEIDGDLPLVEKASRKPAYAIDELAKDDTIRVRTDSAAKYIETSAAEVPSSEILPVEVKKSSSLGLWIPVLLGFLFLGVAAGTLIRGAEALLGVWGPIIAFTGLVIGIGLILSGIYAVLRINSRN